MRIDSVHEILTNNVPFLTFESSKVDNSTVRVTDFTNTLDAVRNIRETGMFSEYCDTILSEEAFVLAVREPIAVSSQSATRFSQSLAHLRSRASTVLDALEEYVRDIPPESVRIKLPEVSSPDQAAELLKEIDTMLNQILVNDYFEGRVRLERFMDGSLWIDLFLGSWIAYRFVAGLVNVYFDVKSKQVEQKSREVMIGDLELEAELRASVLRATKVEVDAYRESRLRELLEEHDVPEDDHEFARRTENSLRMLGSLLERGLEINPALSAPVEEQRLLPDPKRVLEAIRALPSAETDEPVENAGDE